MDEPRGSKRLYVLQNNSGTMEREVLATSWVNLDLFTLPAVSLLTAEASKMIVWVELGL